MIDLSEDMVQRVAQLAHLNLSDEELHYFMGQLSSIVGYVERLNELDEQLLAGLENQDEAVSTLRDDVVASDFSLEAALENAPKKVGTAFQVPKIIE